MQDYDSKLFTEKQIEKTLEENNIRAYFMELDFKNLINEYSSGFQFAKGEINSGFICFKLLYDSKGIILKRGCTVYANIRKTTGETFKSNLTVLDYQNGIVLLSLSSQILSITGVDRLEIVIIIDEEKTISPKVNYTIYESFDCDDKTNEENRPPVLDSEDLRLLITELRKEVEANKVNIEDITKKTGSNLELIQSNTTKISNNTSEIEKIKQYNTNNDSKISNIEKSIEGNTNNISTNADKIKVLENKSNTNESNISSNTSKIEAIGKEIETLKQYDSNNDTRLSEIDSKINVNKASISDNSSKIGVLENKIPIIENNVSENLSNIKEIKGQISTIESSVSKNDSEISKLNENISDIESNVMNVTNKAEEIEKQIPTIESKISDNTSNISTVKTKVEKNTGEITELSKRLDEVAESPKVDLEEIIQARTATTGETFDTLDERIDCEINRLNKKIEVTMLQQDDKESHVIENTIEGMTTDMIIKGRTLQNLKADVKNKISRWVDNGDNYSLNLPSGNGQPSILYGLTQTLKADCKYTVVVDLISYSEGYLHFCFMDNEGSKLASTTEEVADSKGLKKLVFTTNSNEKADTLRLLPRNGVNNAYSVSKNILILEGDWTNKPIPDFFEGIKSFGQQENKISILSHSKNLFDGKSTDCFWSGKVGDKIPDNNIGLTQYSIVVPVKKGLQYSFSGYSNIPPSSQRTSVYFTDINKIIIKTDMIADNVIAPDDGFVYWYACSEGIKPYLKYLQVEEGTQATSYEPYGKYKKDILLSDLGFNEGLKGIDRIYDELDSNKKKAIKRLEKFILNGKLMSSLTDNFSFNDTHCNIWGLKVDTEFLDNGVLISDLPYDDLIWGDYTKEGVRFVNNSFMLCIKNERLKTKDKDGIVEYFTNNPVLGYCQLKSPVEMPLNENINLKTFNAKTYISFENSINGTSSFEAPVSTVDTISRLNRENKNLEEENIILRQDLKATTLSLADSDLELVKQNIDMDFRLMEVEFALDIPQSTLSLNINLKNKKGEVKNMARTPYEMMKIVILSGDYDKDDYISKIERYYERGRMTKEERDELLSLIDADSFINDIE